MNLALKHANKVAVVFWTAGLVVLLARAFHPWWFDAFWYPTFMVCGAIVYASYILGLTIEKATLDVIAANREREMQELRRVVDGYVASNDRVITRYEKAAEDSL